MHKQLILGLSFAGLVGLVAMMITVFDDDKVPSALYGYAQIPMLPSDLPQDGAVQLVLYSLGNTQGLPVVSDQAALRAAQPDAYFFERQTRFQPEGALVFLSNGPPSGARLGAVYVNDVLFAELNCRPGYCGRPLNHTHNYAGLDAFVELWASTNEQFDTQAEWHARIKEIYSDPDLAFFDRDVPEPPIQVYRLSYYTRPK